MGSIEARASKKRPGYGGGEEENGGSSRSDVAGGMIPQHKKNCFGFSFTSSMSPVSHTPHLVRHKLITVFPSGVWPAVLPAHCVRHPNCRRRPPRVLLHPVRRSESDGPV